MIAPAGSSDVVAAVGPRPPATLADLLSIQRNACHEAGSLLYARLLERSLERLDHPGALRDLLVARSGDPFGSALALRFLGGVHRLVLEGRAPELARHYPSMGGHPGPELEDDFQRVVEEHGEILAARIGDGVQTNEVGRSVPLAGALLGVAELGFPLRIFEVGASAGRNLRWDHYRYQAGSSAFGDPASPVHFAEPWTDRRPRLDVEVEVIERRGCDLAPIDATTDDGRLKLRAFVWPDLVARFQRLDAAIDVARRVPAPIDAADGPDWVAERLADRVSGTATVLMHSIFQQYLPTARRTELRTSIAAAGQRATRQAPLAWVRLEPGREGAETRCTLWPGGRERLLSISTYHGPPVRWL
ncbi:MAG: DUF2332 family protein [Acidimicrobiales bacterium]